MTWDDYGIAHSRYVDDTKKIRGEVKEGWRCWHATVDNTRIGDYTEKAAAKRAVETAIAECVKQGFYDL